MKADLGALQVFTQTKRKHPIITGKLRKIINAISSQSVD